LPIADARHGRRLDAAVVEEDHRMMWPTTQGVLFGIATFLTLNFLAVIVLASKGREIIKDLRFITWWALAISILIAYAVSLH
jgi:hypothetical protein